MSMSANLSDTNQAISLSEGTQLYFDYTNSRLKILKCMKLSEKLLENVIELGRREKLGKVISTCRIKDLKYFERVGFVIEGLINGYYKGEDAYCVSLFIDKNRALSLKSEQENEILTMCIEKGKVSLPQKLDCCYEIRNTIESDIPQMVKLFRSVFKTYPSPVFDHDYLKEIMDKKTLFKAAFKDNDIVSIASADIDNENKNAEITDCATYPQYRGQGLLSNLISQLERELISRGFITLYSLSRSTNTGINMSLRKLGYNYSGRLVNNCNICGGFEDMNIWVKNIAEK